MRLDEALERLRTAGLAPHVAGRFDARPVTGVTADSRRIRPGGLFVAVRGACSDGHAYIEQAVESGALGVVCEALPELRRPGVAYAQVRQARTALAELAAAYHGDPSARLALVGITGTNGKTTVAFLLRHALGALGWKTGLVGTVHIDLGGGAPAESTHTTPDALALNAMLAQMVEAGCRACALEVSSHALDQGRVHGLRFAVGVFTNLTQDHLDYHADFDAYRQAKQKLFEMLPPEAAAVYNADDAAGAAFAGATRARGIGYGAGPGADVRLEVLADDLAGLRLRLDGRERRFRLVGGFNAYNLAAAYAALRALGFGAEAALDALAEAPPPPGRFEQHVFADGTAAVIDYAHTPDALHNVLATLAHARPAGARLWCVFGCGGDRDAGKRPLMGQAAEALADVVVVTSDNPRREAPEAIMADIRKGMRRPEAAHWIPDRREAIAYAAAHAAPGDVVLVAGKGHERYQVIGETRHTFDDHEEVRRFFEQRRPALA